MYGGGGGGGGNREESLNPILCSGLTGAAL